MSLEERVEFHRKRIYGRRDHTYKNGDRVIVKCQRPIRASSRHYQALWIYNDDRSIDYSPTPSEAPEIVEFMQRQNLYKVYLWAEVFDATSKKMQLNIITEGELPSQEQDW